MKKQQKVVKAVEEYEKLQSREIHPNGEFDKAGRWYPSESESQDCCSEIRSPSRAYPYSYMVHCRTLAHVCSRVGADIEKAKEIVNAKNKELKEVELKQITKVFKIVAIVGKSYRSVYDNSPWKLGERRNSRKWYVYLNIETAKERMESDNFPSDSKNIDMPKAILECNGYGKVKPTGHGWGKHYCLNVRPIRKVA